LTTIDIFGRHERKKKEDMGICYTEQCVIGLYVISFLTIKKCPKDLLMNESYYIATKKMKYPNMRERVLDKQGIPATCLCFNILKTMFREHNQYFSINDLRALHAAKKKDIELICQGLRKVDFISSNPMNPNEFKYNTHCSQEILQCNFERYIVEVETESIPIYQYLPYSPSSAE